MFTWLRKPRRNSEKESKKDKVASKLASFQTIDLRLNEKKTPLGTRKFRKIWGAPRPATKIVNTLVYGKVYAIGSVDKKSQSTLFYKDDAGLFQCVHEAWMNHWNLRTSPEDWWFSVARRIALAVSDSSMDDEMYDVLAGIGWYGEVDGGDGDDTRMSASPNTSKVSRNEVREMFVSHTGKAQLTLDVPVHTIHDLDYDFVFSSFSEQIRESIKVPEYVDALQSDFSTTTPTHKAASHINLMASLKEFFEFGLVMSGCGLKAVEMAGSQDDWDKLDMKLCRLREILKPIQHILRGEGLNDQWWDHASYCLRQLARTLKDPEHPAVCEFWANIILETKDWTSAGPYEFGPRTHRVSVYNGWLIRLLAGRKDVKINDIGFHRSFGGLNKVPVKVSMTWCDPPVSDEAEMIGGVMGFTRHEDADNGVPSLMPFHIWGMMLPKESKLL